jgi:lipid-binding SYLF domain-containing protein
MVSRALQRFYEANPGTQQQVADEAGYAVFSDIGFKTMFLGGVKGKGMAVNNGTKQETFMKMFQLQPGLGVGIEKFCLLFIFDTPEAFNKFLTSGWELGANVMAAAKHGQKGGAFAKATTLSQDVHMTQIIEKGLIVGVSLTGAKFSRDSELKGGKA